MRWRPARAVLGRGHAVALVVHAVPRLSLLAMNRRFLRTVIACLVVAAAPVGALQQEVPTDLRPLLAAPQSEMRLVVVRYNADRATLSANYAGGNRGGAGRRGGGAPGAGAVDVPISPARIARLKRFDMDWQAALGKIDAAKLTPAAKTDLDTLKASIATDVNQIGRAHV